MVHFHFRNILLLLLYLQFGSATTCIAAQWSIPLAGNAFRTSPELGDSNVGRDMLTWKGAAEVYSIYFHIDREAEIELSILASVPKGHSKIKFRVGDQTFKKELEGIDFREHQIGRIKIETPGYCRVEIQGVDKSGEFFAEIKDLIVSPKSEDVKLDFVRSDEGGMFYWGRRGPSVHLRLDVPEDRQFEFAYSEISVAAGYDPIGSYFMANGFAEGYFGIQVNSEKERRVLFSVWSPYKTDNPKEIPLEQRIVTLAQGPEVHVGEFGNEGSGGQSYLRYPWKAGATYRFLTQVKPDDNGNTIYAAWFSEANTKQWRLIAKFRRPSTSTYLKGFHSFLENFDPIRGHLERRAFYSNQWVRDVNGEWYECVSSHFSVDPTGKDRHRLDYSGGADRGRFYLRNGGFFIKTVNPGAIFVRDSTSNQKPQLDIQSLP